MAECPRCHRRPVATHVPISLGRREKTKYSYVGGRKRRVVEFASRRLKIPLCASCFRWYRWARHGLAIVAVVLLLAGIATTAGCHLHRDHETTYGALALVLFALGFLAGGLDYVANVAVERSIAQIHPRYKRLVADGFDTLRAEAWEGEWDEPGGRKRKTGG